MTRKEIPLHDIHDIVALRVLLDDIGDCYRALGIIHSIYKPVPGRIKDYIAMPKPNGYQSLHTTVFSGDGSIVEIQIRTRPMHDFAEYGIASHYAYKQGVLHQNNKKEKYHALSWLSDLREYNSDESDTDTFFKNLKSDFFEDRIFCLTPKGDVIDMPEGSTAPGAGAACWFRYAARWPSPPRANHFTIPSQTAPSWRRSRRT